MSNHARRKLALFLPTLDDGGAERVMLQLGASFAARGHEVDLLLAVPGGRLDGQVPSTIRTVQLGAPRTIRALPALARYLRKQRPVALLSTLEHSNILAVVARTASFADTRIVLREANVLDPTDQQYGFRTRLLRALMRRTYTWAQAVVAVSRSVARSMIDDLGIPASVVRTIYNPVLTSDLPLKAAAPLEDPWFAPGAPPVVLGVGRLAPQKDFASLLRAFRRVLDRRRARLVILGEGPERGALESLSNQLGIGSDVRLAGFDHNPLRYMSRAPVFALSSAFEGLPGALIQAMACGCRVISTDAPGGSREAMTDEHGKVSGRLVPVGDDEALAEGIVALLDEHARGPARVTHQLDRFREDSSVRGYLDVLGVGTAA